MTKLFRSFLIFFLFLKLQVTVLQHWQNHPPSSTVGHQKQRVIEQTPIWCHHCPGWSQCFLKHPDRSAKKDTESQAINKWIVVSTQTTALFRATNFFQKESKLLFYQLTKLYSYELQPPSPWFILH